MQSSEAYNVRMAAYISVFLNKYNSSKPIGKISLWEALNDVYSGGDDAQRKTIHEVRTCTEPIARDKAKGKLKAFTFQGVFSPSRLNENIEQSSGIMMLDFDKLTPDEFIQQQEALRTDPCVLAYFKSASGVGIRVLYAIPFVSNDKEYKGRWNAVFEIYPKLDIQCKDLARLSFVSHDPEIYVNTNVQVFDGMIHEPTAHFKARESTQTDWTEKRILRVIGDKIRAATTGFRHAEILAAARLAGGYIASGTISEDQAVEVLRREAYIIDPSDFKINEKAIYDGINHGKRSPVYFEDRRPVSAVFNADEDGDDSEHFYVPFDGYDEDIEQLIQFGDSRGNDSRYSVAKPFVSFKKQCFTLIYSSPYSGKTQYAFSEVVNLAERDGWKFAVYSVETGEPKHIWQEVTMIRYKIDNVKTLTREQILESKQFFKKHFFVIDPLYKRALTPVTIDNVYATVEIIEEQENIKLDSVVIDPLTEIESEQNDARIDLFMAHVLKATRADARINNRHNFIITHVRDQKPIFDTASGKTYFPVPTPREISGGQNPYKFGQQMICVYRPDENIIDKNTGSPPEPNETQIYVQKSKPKGIGRIGNFKLYYSIKKNTYYESPYAEFATEEYVPPTISLKDAFSMDDPEVKGMF